jgi:hypothetical protein
MQLVAIGVSMVFRIVIPRVLSLRKFKRAPGGGTILNAQLPL